MAQAREYPCGCIVHDLAGPIRRCPGSKSKTLSGKPARGVRGDDSAERSHASAMKSAEDKIKLYEVADHLP